MTLEPEAVGLRRRLSLLQRSLEHASDPLSVTLVRMVIEEIEERLAALAAIENPNQIEQPQPALQQQQPQQRRMRAHRCGRIANPVFSIRPSCSARRRPARRAPHGGLTRPPSQPNYRRADRKKRLARLLMRRPVGIVLSEHTADDGATIFRQACVMGLEGSRVEAAERALTVGPSRDWLKVKYPDSPAMIRAREAEW